MAGPSTYSVSEVDRRPHLTQPGEGALHAAGGIGINHEGNSRQMSTGHNIAATKIGTLGEFIKMDAENLVEYGSWERLFHEVKGRSNFTTHLDHLPHRAAALLHRYSRTGVPVVVHSPPWSHAQKDAAVDRGNHPSVQTYEDFVSEEMLDMRKKGIFVLLPYESLRDQPSLRISPLGCVPQRERRPRIINDYTFSGINPTTMKLAPPEAMQWGRTFHRVLWYIFTADRRHGPVLLSKTDLADGFYQLPLTPTGALKLAVPLQVGDGKRYLAVPTRLPMGWTESPPAFSAVTETISDLVNAQLEERPLHIPPSHPLEGLASTSVALDNPTAKDAFPLIDTGPLRPPLAYTDVYVDDFIKLAQTWINCLRVRRSSYHCIDAVFRPNDAQDVGRKNPISEKKLLKGDDFWSTQKVILGWMVDTLTQTVQLPSHREQRLLEMLQRMLRRRRASESEWHKLLGELRSMSLAIPGSVGCFSFLQEALKPGLKRISLSPPVKDQLKDLLWLATSLKDRPTHLAEIVPTPPTYIGAVDAAKKGMGGVWFNMPVRLPLSIQPQPADRLQRPTLWRARFPPAVQEQLVSFENPTGSITNSDLELSGTIGHDAVLAHEVPVQHLTTCTLTDNTPTVAWRQKGSVTTTGPAAYLLRLSALHRRHHRYKPETHYLPGTLNAMADDCSRRWDLYDSQLLDYFNTNYPQPQPWTMSHLPHEMHSALISSLRKKRLKPASFLHERKRLTVPGKCGVRFAPQSLLTPSCRTWPILSRIFKPLPSAGEMAESHRVRTPTELARWRTPFALSHRHFPAWGPRTLV